MILRIEFIRSVKASVHPCFGSGLYACTCPRPVLFERSIDRRTDSQTDRQIGFHVASASESASSICQYVKAHIPHNLQCTNRPTFPSHRLPSAAKKTMACVSALRHYCRLKRGEFSGGIDSSSGRQNANSITASRFDVARFLLGGKIKIPRYGVAPLRCQFLLMGWWEVVCFQQNINSSR